jgi:integrase
MTTNRTGIATRHQRQCATNHGKRRCTCSPRYRVQIRREDVHASKTFATLAEAERWKKDAETRIAFGHHLPAEDTVGDALRRLDDALAAGTALNSSGRAYKPGTAKSYRLSIARYLLPALGGRLARTRTSDLSQQHVAALRDELIASGISGSTISNATMPLRVLVSRESERGNLERDPFRGVKWPSKESTPARWATVTEAETLLGVLDGADRAYCAIAFFAGLRVGEISALRWEDVNLDTEEPYIAVHRAFDQKTNQETTPKTAKGARAVPVADQLVPLLREYRAALATTGGAERIAPAARLFHGRDGEYLRGAVVLKRCQSQWARRDLAGIAVKLHEARHTFASLAVAAGVDIYHLSRIMGHASIQITLDRYGHLYPDGLAEARRLLSAYLGERLTTGALSS